MPRRLIALIFLLFTSAALGAEPAPLEFRLTFDKAAHAQPFTGRVFVLLNKKETKDLPGGLNWFAPEPIFARDVKDWKPGEPLVIGADAIAFPQKLAELPKTTYSISAVMDLDRGSRHFTTAEGNIYSAAVRRELDPKTTGSVELVLNKTFHERPFNENDRVKLVDIESKLLSEFHKGPVRLRAGVVLPKTYAANPDKKYPIVYEIPGFGGNHFGAFLAATRDATDVAGVDVLHVTLDPACRFGHHVFADSDNNGPCGQALITELIPQLEKKFRVIGEPGARFLTGHSSGGWSSLWLQINYPEHFGGCWSTAPDSVDFRDFQKVNVYKEGESLFTDADGKLRPIARIKGKVVLHTKPFCDMEEVMGHGGQFGSFEAVFGPRGSDGKPKRLWDRMTGKIDPEIAKTWERYDIRLVLERNWKTRAPNLAGKIHVYMGAEDTFYLDGATALLKESLARLGSDAVVEIFPGKDHGSLMDKALRERIAREMAAAFRNKK
jgi:S-formylglutathione hydrolase FrmB